MKRCFKCGEVQPLSQFYRHPRMADGHLNKCRRCTRRDVQENRERRLQHYPQYDRDRYQFDAVRALVTNLNGLKRDPVKRRAMRSVANELKAGRMTKGPCEVCGASKVDAHHPDYNEPFVVVWLCRKHHMQLHRVDLDRRPHI